MKIREERPEVVPVMVGTAGHVDHGKTALVKLLTGCDTDRLREERERGLSINLGFAPCRMPGERLVGIVDVPGHEDFIRNMVAGAAFTDVLMLAVAADDGVMPQTEEHVKIVKLLRKTAVLAVLTKIDLVDAEHLEMVREDLAAFLARMGFPEAPVIPASNKTLEGIPRVREKLLELVAAARRSPDGRAFRMNVERSFSAEGYGTVATGVPASGTAAAGDRLELLPDGRLTGVRALESYRHEAELARAGACAALNLRDLAPGEVGRGQTLAFPGVYRATVSALAAVENVSGSLSLKHGREVRFHSGTAAVLAKARLLDCRELGPGGRAFMQLRLAEPLVLAAGDRFVIRSLTPVTTLGGGVVLSARAARARASTPGLLERLGLAHRAALAGDFLGSELLAGPEALLDRAELVRLTQMPPDEAGAAIAEKEERGEIVDLGAGAALVRARAGEPVAAIEKALERYHAANGSAWGMEPGQVCRLLGLEAGGFAKLAGFLTAGGRMALKHGRLALASWQPAVSARVARLREALLERLVSAGAGAPARGDLIGELGASEADMRSAVRLLVEEGRARLLGNNLMLGSVLQDCRGKLLELFETSPVVGLPAFRKSTGLSRNLAVAVLEAFDTEGLTRRVENGRALLEARRGEVTP